MSGRKFYIVLRVFSSSHKASWSKYNCPQVASVQRPAWETKLAVTSAENRAIGPKIADVDKTVAMTEAWGDSPAVEAPQGAPRITAWVALEAFLVEVTQQGRSPLPRPWAGVPATASTARLLENGTQAGRRAPIPRGLPHMSESAMEALTITKSIVLVRLALASSRIAGLSLFLLLPPPPSSSSLSRMRLAPPSLDPYERRPLAPPPPSASAYFSRDRSPIRRVGAGSEGYSYERSRLSPVSRSSSTYIVPRARESYTERVRYAY